MLSEILLEEQHRRELSKAVKELLGDPNDYIVKKSLQAKKVEIIFCALSECNLHVLIASSKGHKTVLLSQ